MAPSQKKPNGARKAAAADANDDITMENAGSEDEELFEGVSEDDDEMDDADADLEGAAAELDLEDASEFEEDDGQEDDAEEAEAEEGGVPISPSAVPAIGSAGAPTTTSVPSMSLDDAAANPSLNPTRPIPYTHDAGHLLVTDANPIQLKPGELKISEAHLAATARDAAQSLLNHLLTTCPITSAKNATSGSGVVMTLPPPEFQLPREKPVPVPKPPTKWEQFAAKKGIGKTKRRNQDGENRAGKKVYDEESGEWVARYGYKGKNKSSENEWLVEIDTKAERRQAEEGKAGRDPRTVSRAERVERAKRNERKMRANERKATKGK